MSSREEILAAIKKNKPGFSPLPEMKDFAVEGTDLFTQFSEMLKKVGGEVIQVKNEEELNHQVNNLYNSHRVVCSTIPNLKIANLDISTIKDPLDLENVDLAIIKGELAVAENAAIWVKGSTLGHLALPVITQHLVVVVNKSDMVQNMHLAYKKIEIEVPGYGVFIAGPSKTADIEQSLVIGAHGARSLRVFIIG